MNGPSESKASAAGCGACVGGVAGGGLAPQTMRFRPRISALRREPRPTEPSPVTATATAPTEEPQSNVGHRRGKSPRVRAASRGRRARTPRDGGGVEGGERRGGVEGGERRGGVEGGERRGGVDALTLGMSRDADADCVTPCNASGVNGEDSWCWVDSNLAFEGGRLKPGLFADSLQRGYYKYCDPSKPSPVLEKDYLGRTTGLTRVPYGELIGHYRELRGRVAAMISQSASLPPELATPLTTFERQLDNDVRALAGFLSQGYCNTSSEAELLKCQVRARPEDVKRFLKFDRDFGRLNRQFESYRASVPAVRIQPIQYPPPPISYTPTSAPPPAAAAPPPAAAAPPPAAAPGWAPLLAPMTAQLPPPTAPSAAAPGGLTLADLQAQLMRMQADAQRREADLVRQNEELGRRLLAAQPQQQAPFSTPLLSAQQAPLAVPLAGPSGARSFFSDPYGSRIQPSSYSSSSYYSPASYGPETPPPAYQPASPSSYGTSPYAPYAAAAAATARDTDPFSYGLSSPYLSSSAAPSTSYSSFGLGSGSGSADFLSPAQEAYSGYSYGLRGGGDRPSRDGGGTHRKAHAHSSI